MSIPLHADAVLTHEIYNLLFLIGHLQSEASFSSKKTEWAVSSCDRMSTWAFTGLFSCRSHVRDFSWSTDV